MQYKREEVRDMNLYGEILKKLEGTPCLALERSFVGEEGNLADMRCELREGAEASEIGKEALTQGQPVCGRAGSSWNVAEPFFPKERLIILGGGHVALPVAEFGARVGFLVTVVDDRLSFANPGRFPMAEKVICDDFGHAIKELKIQESDYICIVTRGHRHDADCLRMIGKGKEPAYLGMIGSPRRYRETGASGRRLRSRADEPFKEPDRFKDRRCDTGGDRDLDFGGDHTGKAHGSVRQPCEKPFRSGF